MMRLAIFTFLFLASVSFSVTPITGCREVDNITDTSYVLANNVSGANISATPLSDTACIKIISSNIIFDCVGYNISNNGTGSTTFGILLNGSVTNVTVKNCPRIADYSIGIYLHTGSNSNTLTNNTAYNNTDGFTIVSSSNNTLTNNTAVTSTIGFTLLSSSNNTLTNNTAINSSFYGFILDVSSNNILTNNIAYNNSENGFELRHSTFNTLENNTAFDNNKSGFRLSNSAHNVLFNNSAADNALDGFIAIVISEGTNNTFTDNTAHGNGGDGFEINADSDNTLVNNTAFNNSVGVNISSSNNTRMTGDHLFNNTIDFTVDGTSIIINLTNVILDNPLGNFQNYTNLSINDSVDSAFTMDHASPIEPPENFTSVNGAYVNITNTTTGVSIDKIVWHWSDSEIGSLAESPFELWKFNASSWVSVNATPDTTANTLSLSNHNPASIYAILTSGVTTLSNCTNITEPGSYKLISNVSGAPINASPLTNTTCIKIATSNVTFDCNGFNITNNGTGGTTFGILLNGSVTNVTVKNCPRIASYTNGIYLHTGSNNNTLTNNAAYNNSGFGFFFMNSSNNILTNNTALNNSDDGFAFNFIEGEEEPIIGASSNNTLTSNKAEENGAFGFQIWNSTNNTLTDNIANMNRDAGFTIIFANNTTLVNNTATFNDDGISVFVSNNTVMINNTASNSPFRGFELGGNINLVLINNTASNNSENGFELSGVDAGELGMFPSINNTLINNTAYNNSEDGFQLSSSDFNDTGSSIFINNTAYNNSQNGLSVIFLNTAIFSNNTAYDNGENGIIFVPFSNNTIVSNNTAFGNGVEDEAFGMIIAAIFNNGIITDNSAYSNNGSGLFIIEVNNSVIFNNTAYDNNGFGLAFVSVNNSVIYNNTAYNNSLHGVSLIDSSFNLLENNTAYSNAGDGFRLEDVEEEASSNTLTNNTAYYNENGYHLVATEGNSLLNNSAFNNSVYGFYLELSSNNTLANNLAESNAEYGILLSSSDNNSIINNTVNNSGSTGLAVDYSDGNNVTGNLATNSLYDGIGSSFGNYNVFDRNTVYLNMQDGIAIVSSSFDNVTNNIAYNNSRAGFIVRLSSYNILANNTAYGNIVDGFLVLDVEAAPASSNNLTNNTAHDNENGYHLINTDNNTLIRCVAYNNSNAGFLEEGTHIIGTTIINSWFYDNPWEIVQQAPQEPVNFTIIKSKLGNSSINISLSDVLTNGYRLNDTTDPSDGAVKPNSTSAVSFKHKYLKVDFQDEPQLDELAFHWTGAEASLFAESSIKAFVWNGTNWTLTPNQTTNAASNNITVVNVTNITSDDIYGLYATPALPSPNEDNSLSVNFASSCDGNMVTVTSRGDPLEDARVAIDGTDVQYTNGSGQVTFEGCGKTVNIHVTRSGYASEDLTGALVSCEQCLVPCECGQIVDNQCVPYQCCSYEDCPAGQQCEANVCVERCEPPSCCTSDGQCGVNETCRVQQGAATGKCEELAVCGLVENHTIAESWECGGPYCPGCPEGFLCDAHRCVQDRLSCPSTGFVGEEKSCQGIVKGEPCANCDYEITDPTGKKSKGRTDENGNFVFPLGMEGTYKVALLDKDGDVLKIVKVKSLPRSEPIEPVKPTVPATDPTSMLWVLLLLGLIIAAVLYWKKGKK